jgi:carbonic anhydrase
MKSVEIVYRYEALEGAAAARPVDAEAARQRLNEGNRAFSDLLGGLTDEGGPARRTLRVDARDLGLDQGEAKSPKQKPFAAMVGCSDARVPVELVFGVGPNDLFVVRVAGNVLGSEVLGSLKYAAEHLGESLKVITVLGHSGCGALTAAVDVFLTPANYLTLATSHALRGIIDRLLVVVQAAAKGMADIVGPDVTGRPGYRDALIEVAILLNAALAAYTIQQEVDAHDPQGLRAVYGVYLLETRRIWAPQVDDAAAGGLVHPPGDRAAFAELGRAVVRSERISSILMAS